MSSIMQFLSELKHVDDEVSRIRSKTNELMLNLKEVSQEILKKFVEDAKEVEEDILSEIKEDLKKKSAFGNQRIFERDKKEILLMRSKAQERMDELIRTALEIVLDSA